MLNIVDIIRGSSIELEDTADSIIEGMMDNADDDLIDDTVSFFYRIAKKLNTDITKLCVARAYEYSLSNYSEARISDRDFKITGVVKKNNLEATLFSFRGRMFSPSVEFAIEVTDNGDIFMYFKDEDKLDEFCDDLSSLVPEEEGFCLSESLLTDFQKDLNQKKLDYYKEFPNANVKFEDALKLFNASKDGDAKWYAKPVYSEEAWNQLLDLVRDKNEKG